MQKSDYKKNCHESNDPLSIIFRYLLLQTFSANMKTAKVHF